MKEVQRRFHWAGCSSKFNGVKIFFTFGETRLCVINYPARMKLHKIRCRFKKYLTAKRWARRGYQKISSRRALCSLRWAELLILLCRVLYTKPSLSSTFSFAVLTTTNIKKNSLQTLRLCGGFSYCFMQFLNRVFSVHGCIFSDPSCTIFPLDFWFPQRSVAAYEHVKSDWCSF